MFNFRRPTGDTDQPASIGKNQKRQSYRATLEFPVIYVVDGRPGTRTASANDLSVGGLRLLGDEDFTKETVIDFRFTLPTNIVANVFTEKEIEERSPFGVRKRRVKVPPTPFTPMELAGRVVIAFYNVRTQKFAHGVRFLHIGGKVEEELQRFIHLYQLKILRDRADRGVG